MLLIFLDLDLPASHPVPLLDLLLIGDQFGVGLDHLLLVLARLLLLQQHLPVLLVELLQFLQRALQKLTILGQTHLLPQVVLLLLFCLLVQALNHRVHVRPLLPQLAQLCLILFSNEGQVDRLQLLLLLLANSLEKPPLALQLLNHRTVRLDLLGVFFAYRLQFEQIALQAGVLTLMA